MMSFGGAILQLRRWGARYIWVPVVGWYFRREEAERRAVLDDIEDVEAVLRWMLDLQRKVSTFHGQMYSAGEWQILDFLSECHRGYYSKRRLERVKRIIVEEKLFEWFERYHLQPFYKKYYARLGDGQGVEINNPDWFALLKKQNRDKRQRDAQRLRSRHA